MTDKGWQRIIRLMDETVADYLTGMAALRERVVADLKRELSDSQGLNRSHVAEESSLRDRPASTARHRRTRGNRPRR